MEKILLVVGGWVIGLVTAFFASFIKSAGAYCWKRIEERIHPAPVSVADDFVPDGFQRSNLAWPLDIHVKNMEAKGYRLYKDKKGAACMKQIRNSKGERFTQLLMVKK